MRIPGGSLKMHKIKPALLLILTKVAPKRAKQEKENAKNAHH
jgi:hypothetical protein